VDAKEVPGKRASCDDRLSGREPVIGQEGDLVRDSATTSVSANIRTP
jgi:hypothetical protein